MDTKTLKGYLMTFSAYVIWGIMPIYWKQLTELPALQLISMRIIITVISLLVFVVIMKQKDFIHYLKDSKTRKQLMVSSFFIAVNWGIFVYAVNAGYMIQASLGYYMNPLLSVLLGIFVLREKLTKPQYVSLAFATIGVVFLTISYGEIPWISLLLGGSFALYGLFKKVYQLNSINSMLVETLYLMPFTLVIVLVSQTNSPWMGQVHLLTWIILSIAGLITAIPLVLFSDGAKSIPLSAVGFLQYVAPTLMLLIGVVLYKEVFTLSHKISFAFIWIGLLIYSISVIKGKRTKCNV